MEGLKASPSFFYSLKNLLNIMGNLTTAKVHITH